MDCTVQQCNKPTGTFADAKPLFSGKHGIHCLKSEVGHAPHSGVAMWVSSGHPGARHDFDIYKKNLSEWSERLHKTNEEKQHSGNSSYWAQLADKGYQGANNLNNVWVITPHKPTPHHPLSPEQKAENRALASDCIVCENFYGHLKILFQIVHDRWKGDRQRYPRVFTNCVALTNFHIVIGNPLRHEEANWYRAHLQKLKADSEEKKRKRQEQQEASRRRRRHRLGIRSPVHSSSSSSTAS